VVDFLPKVKIEVPIKAELLERVIEAIEKAANTRKIGDGKIFVTTWSRSCASARAKPAPTPFEEHNMKTLFASLGLCLPCCLRLDAGAGSSSPRWKR